MLYLFIWWILLILLGWAALPVTLRFMHNLPGRGYAFAKPLALLLIAYPFWLLTSLGFLQNTQGAIALAVLAVALLTWGYAWWQRAEQAPWTWLRANARYIVAVEVVFSIAYFAFAYYRSYNPEITATEKPMEFMFLNSILKSAQFPPRDAWLSGYAISYYYLGYVVVALLTKLSAVPSNYAFNLALCAVFAMSATGAFGLAYDLARGAVETREALEPPRKKHAPRARAYAPYVTGVLAVFLLLIIGNLEAPFESLHNAGLGSPQFYRWLDINGLAEAPQSGTLVPADNWWWWRASRVVNDHNPLTGVHVEVIDEFPAFSFLLGDMHPHVLALPFGLLALAVAFNLLRAPLSATETLVITPISAGTPSRRGFEQLWVITRKTVLDAAAQWLTPGLLFTAVIVGSLGMLNTWDIITYGFIVAMAFALAHAQRRAAGRWSNALLLKSALFGVLLMAVSYLLYLPFYIGFSSQFRGFNVEVFSKTPLHQYLLMFGIFILVLAGFVGVLVWQRRGELRSVLREAGAYALMVLMAPVLIVVAGLVVLARSAELREQLAGLLKSPNPGQITSQLLGAFVSTLAANPGVFILLTVLLACVVTLARRELDAPAESVGAHTNTSVLFTLLLAFTAVLLTFGVEFLFVRDTFETRMNTVFKLYYQAWTLFAIASAFGAYYIWRVTRGAGRAAWVGAFGVMFALSLVYPALAIPSKANDFKKIASAGIPTLDGTRWIKNSFPDDYAAIEWLNARAPNDAVILEAPGAQYSFFDRVSMATGLPTVLGWGGHELQWRGNYDEAGKREADVERIFKTSNVQEARALLSKYGVRYVIVGGLERDKYALTPPLVEKFAKLGQLVFNQGALRIYQINP